MEYSEKVLDHFMKPRNMGEIPDATASGTVGNPICGDIMKMDLKIVDNVIVDAKFKTFGCGSAIATSSMATELIIGKTTDEALDITNQAVAEALDGLPKVKMHCSVLAEQAVKKALEQFYLENDMMTPERQIKFGILSEEHDH
ncbi:MAG: Fe-S cluster assembly scaffold protein NifU [Clostridiaceae bacterium]|jgi:nitrogen fixation NifU-like protein|nr:Fe-S cluster assembly scaffold protein NifU [Clostridiales bacterium]MDD2572810.1 Fe-S cluster assembly scaffold protein NifU [Eubacteriales bacterium]MDY0119989.1 Fe-S cluster assembly scaffold protein NifU [Clostridia bacterium]NLG30614.1 Fe-S cluster assembly scaffold protein NifU [Clostridiaceae bacterium]MDD3539822.1 Fe-S cluster assembly scaffold protein NifU [Eubacteriales bacterium]